MKAIKGSIASSTQTLKLEDSRLILANSNEWYRIELQGTSGKVNYPLTVGFQHVLRLLYPFHIGQKARHVLWKNSVFIPDHCQDESSTWREHSMHEPRMNTA